MIHKILSNVLFCLNKGCFSFEESSLLRIGLVGAILLMPIAMISRGTLLNVTTLQKLNLLGGAQSLFIR